jgi:hypothetical protein
MKKYQPVAQNRQTQTPGQNHLIRAFQKLDLGDWGSSKYWFERAAKDSSPCVQDLAAYGIAICNAAIASPTAAREAAEVEAKKQEASVGVQCWVG